MQLTTTRLKLRDFQKEDWRRVAEYRSDPRYLRYYPEKAATAASSRDFVKMVMGWAAQQPRQKFQLAVLRASDGVLLGNCGVRITSAENREAEFGCEFDPREWDQGYATEAGREIIEYGFGTLGMHRIWSQTISENTAAVKLAQRLGMRPEGRLRENQFFQGRCWDTLLYAVLDQEWREQ
jgi:RimJ/RimL family protein N-acetyltransferase